MIEFWYGILLLMVVIYLITDGWNIGAGMAGGMIHATQAQRGAILHALGTSWSWYEVWLIGSGGVLFLAFPGVYASAFSGFYLAFFLMLWSLILRGAAIELRHLIDDGLWRAWWDSILTLSSTLLAAEIGLVAGNLVRGVPVDVHGDVTLPFFTDFRPVGQTGLLDWYTSLVAVFSIVLFLAHGTGYVARLPGPLHQLLARASRRAWIGALTLLPIITLLTVQVRPDLLQRLLTHPWTWPAVAALLTGVALIVASLVRERPRVRFAGGCLLLLGLVTSTAAVTFPILVRSSLVPDHSLDVYQCAADHHGLAVSAWWVIVTLIAAGGYFLFIIRHERPTAATPPHPEHR